MSYDGIALAEQASYGMRMESRSYPKACARTERKHCINMRLLTLKTGESCAVGSFRCGAIRR